MAFDSTIGGASANSYVSIADADTYFDDRGKPSDWENAGLGTCQAALIYATAWLDQNFTWYSTIYSTDQALGWPRVQYYDAEGRQVGGSGVIPQKVKDAVCEMALQWIKDDFTSTDNEGIESESIGDASITYRKSTKSYSFIKIMLKEYGTPNKSNNPTLYRAD